MRRRLAALVLTVIAAACERSSSEPPVRSRRSGAEVPGVETAIVATAAVRDVVRTFGVVAAEPEPAAVRDARIALAEAEARHTLAEQQVRRLEPLTRLAVAPQKELEAAHAEAAAARAAAERARRVLAGFGSGLERAVLGPGEAWVIAHVMQLDVPHVEAGAEVSFIPDAFRETYFLGRLDSGPAYVDATSSSAPVRARVRDPDARLRPGMTGGLQVEVGAPREAVLVPVPAVVYDDAQPVVFVDGVGRYTRRPVTLGVARDGQVEIRTGVATGERVVVTGAASLLSATRLPAGGEH